MVLPAKNSTANKCDFLGSLSFVFLTFPRERVREGDAGKGRKRLWIGDGGTERELVWADNNISDNDI